MVRLGTQLLLSGGTTSMDRRGQPQRKGRQALLEKPLQEAFAERVSEHSRQAGDISNEPDPVKQKQLKNDLELKRQAIIREVQEQSAVKNETQLNYDLFSQSFKAKADKAVADKPVAASKTKRKKRRPDHGRGSAGRPRHSSEERYDPRSLRVRRARQYNAAKGGDGIRNACCRGTSKSSGGAWRSEPEVVHSPCQEEWVENAARNWTNAARNWTREWNVSLVTLSIMNRVCPSMGMLELHFRPDIPVGSVLHVIARTMGCGVDKLRFLEDGEKIDVAATVGSINLNSDLLLETEQLGGDLDEQRAAERERRRQEQRERRRQVDEAVERKQQEVREKEKRHWETVRLEGNQERLRKVSFSPTNEQFALGSFASKPNAAMMQRRQQDRPRKLAAPSKTKGTGDSLVSRPLFALGSFASKPNDAPTKRRRKAAAPSNAEDTGDSLFALGSFASKRDDAPTKRRRKAAAPSNAEGTDNAPKKKRRKSTISKEEKQVEEDEALARAIARSEDEGAASAAKPKKKAASKKRRREPAASEPAASDRCCTIFPEGDACTRKAYRNGICEACRWPCNAERCRKQGRTSCGGYCGTCFKERLPCDTEGCKNTVESVPGSRYNLCEDCRRTCSVDGCSRPAKYGGKCTSHTGNSQCNEPGCPSIGLGILGGFCSKHAAEHEPERYDAHRGRVNKRRRERYHTDPDFKLGILLRSRLGYTLKAKFKTSYKGKSKLVGCTPRQLRLFIEQQFVFMEEEGEMMSWENHGRPEGRREGWEVEHGKPVEAFDLNDPKDLEKVNHWSNLMPLHWKINADKGKTYDEKDFRWCPERKRFWWFNDNKNWKLPADDGDGDLTWEEIDHEEDDAEGED